MRDSRDRQPAAAAQLLCVRPDLHMHDLRGNIDTRLRKLDEGYYDAIILAEAGLWRLGLAERITQTLPMALMLPAVGQGAGHRNSAPSIPRCGRRCAIGSRPHQAGRVGRAGHVGRAPRRLPGPDCGLRPMRRRKLAAHRPGADADGLQKIEATQTAAPEDAVELGQQVAAALQLQGADALIEAARSRP